MEIEASTWGDGIAWDRSSERVPTFWVDPHHIVEVIGLEDAYRALSAQPCYDDLNHETLTVVGESSDGASTGSGSWGSSQTGSYSGWSSQGTVSFSIGNEGNSTTGGPKGTVEVGQGCFCETLTNEEETDRGSERPNDCPEGELLVPINVEEEFIEILADFAPSCHSFNFTQVGTANWQCAAVMGVMTDVGVFNWSALIEGGTFYSNTVTVFNQPIYFQLPGTIPAGLAADHAAEALYNAFIEYDDYYDTHYMDDYIALETHLRELIAQEMAAYGGTATLTPPYGFTGTVSEYIRSEWGSDRCH